MPRAVTIGLTLIWALCLSTSITSAHPLGNFTVNRYTRLEVRPDGIRIRYVLDLAEIPSLQETRAADINGDGVVSPDEWQAYKDRTLDELRRNLELSVDGAPVDLTADESTLATPLGQGNLPLIRIEAWFHADPTWQASDAQTHRVTFRDRNEPARPGWREIVVRGESGVTLGPSTAPTIDMTEELQNYPDRLLQDPLNIRDVSFVFTPFGGASAPSSAPTTAGGGGAARRPTDAFANLVAAADLNMGVVLLALLGAAALGGIHAASPGHGKTVMAAYLVGSRGTMLHATVLALSVTVSHTAGVLVLGAITLLATSLVFPEQLYPWLSLVSAVLVLGLGGRLLYVALRLSRHQHAYVDHHQHDAHDGTPEQPHDVDVEALPVTWRSLATLGLAGGLVPSGSALVVLLSSMALGRLGFGLLLIVAFGLGMAGVLTMTGVLLVYAGRLLTSYVRVPVGVMRGVPLASASIMLLIGLVAIVQSLAQFGLF